MPREQAQSKALFLWTFSAYGAVMSPGYLFSTQAIEMFSPVMGQIQAPFLKSSVAKRPFPALGMVDVFAFTLYFFALCIQQRGLPKHTLFRH